MSATDDLTQPPAKRQRLEPISPAMSNTPLEDSDDDLYDVPGSAALPTTAEIRPIHKMDTQPTQSLASIPGLQLLQSNESPASTSNPIPGLGDGESGRNHTLATTDISQAQCPEIRTSALASTTNPDATMSSHAEDSSENLLNMEGIQTEPLAKQEYGEQGGQYSGMVLPMDGLITRPTHPPDSDFIHAGNANHGDENAEWQLDSSAEDSSSDSSTETSSDSDSDDSVLLDPEEQARILMTADLDEDPGSENRTLRTHNEQTEEEFCIPEVAVTPEMKITELGNIENIVGNLALVRANISGEYRVVESGSVICLHDRKVIGSVCETLGRVQEPLYSIGFSNPSVMHELGVAKGISVFYVDEHSTFVFTQPLRQVKGSDASNIHDEEIGGHEIEFSDDEAEREYKRSLRQNKEGKKTDRQTANQPKGTFTEKDNPNGSGKPISTLNYDDEDNDMYKPLARPSNFQEMMLAAGTKFEGRIGRPSKDQGKARGRGERERGQQRKGGRQNGNAASDGAKNGGNGRHREDSRRQNGRQFDQRGNQWGGQRHEDSVSMQTQDTAVSQPQPAVYNQPPLQNQPAQLPFQTPTGWSQTPLLSLANMPVTWPPQPQATTAQGANFSAPAFMNPLLFQQQLAQAQMSLQANSFAAPPQPWNVSPTAPTSHTQPQATQATQSAHSPGSNAAFDAAQQQLNILRSLTRTTGPQ